MFFIQVCVIKKNVYLLVVIKKGKGKKRWKKMNRWQISTFFPPVGRDDEFDFCDKNFSIFKGKRKKKNHLTV